MLGVAADAEDPAVDLGVEGLDPAVEALGGGGVLGDVGYGEAGGAEFGGGSAGGEEVDRLGGEVGAERDYVGFVGDGD